MESVFCMEGRNEDGNVERKRKERRNRGRKNYTKNQISLLSHSTLGTLMSVLKLLVAQMSFRKQ